MSFAKEFELDREELYEYEALQNLKDFVKAQEAILENIVLKEFEHLHKLVPTATYFRVTFHAKINGVITYTTRLNGEYNCKDSVVTGIDKHLMSLAVMTCKKYPWKAPKISAREGYDTETEMAEYTFEFFG